MASYSQIATVTAQYEELAVFRQFRSLSMKVLLSLQTELLYLEEDVELIEKRDSKEASTRDLNRCWRLAKDASLQDNRNTYHSKMKTVQGRLKEYHETLLRISRIYQMKRPDTLTMRNIRDWMLIEIAQAGTSLHGIEADPWTPFCEPDIVRLSPSPDKLATSLAARIAPTYHKILGRRFSPSQTGSVDEEQGQTRLWHYDTRNFARVGDVLAIILSTSVLNGSTMALSYVQDLYKRFWIMAMFSVAFASILLFVAGCRRVDVFMATAAFAAVQIVFIQQQQPGCIQNSCGL